MHPELDDVLVAFGMHKVRAGILRVASRRGAVTAEVLMNELHIARATLGYHIRPLVAAGLLRESTDPARANAPAGFNRLLWTVDVDALRAHLATLEAALLSDDGLEQS